MKIYTKQGDHGETGLVGGGRVAKDDTRIEAVGTVDELSASLGIVCAHTDSSAVVELLRSIQNDLFVLGSQLATPNSAKCPAGEISETDIGRLEVSIDLFQADLAPLTTFILPGGTIAASHLHMARVICRRAERRLVAMSRHSNVPDQLVPYLNRLSDLLFVLARTHNANARTDDIPWPSNG